MDHPTFIFPKTVLSDPPSYEKHLKAYEAYIINCALELFTNKNDISMKAIKRDAFEIVKLESQLVNLMTWNENVNNLTHVYRKITIEHLQFLTDIIPLQHSENRVSI